MMPRAKIPMRPSAPPVNIDTMPPMPWPACSINWRKAAGVDSGNRNECAQAVDNQKADGEQDAVAQICGLAKGSPAGVRRHLFCC